MRIILVIPGFDGLLRIVEICVALAVLSPLRFVPFADRRRERLSPIPPVLVQSFHDAGFFGRKVARFPNVV
jgi:hypothetical protein